MTDDSTPEERQAERKAKEGKLCALCKLTNLRGEAHKCPHGNQCRHRSDWKSPECDECCHPLRRHIPKYHQKYFAKDFAKEFE